ncbi:hypothetical protein [Leptospira santarosai]|uniref:hypothetical protein n=1 Tax=Leptospira santarosai TaxID=28183 RepID=UPI0007737D67
MPNCDFYAAREDNKALLELLFLNGGCRVYESYSHMDAELVEFSSMSDLERHFGIADWHKPLRESILLQILPMNAGPVTVERIALDPAKCNGATFRYSANGWGLVQLHLEAERGDKMRASNSNHNSEKRALAWASTYPDMPGPSAWDWVHVVSFSNRLNRVIRKLGVEKAGSRTILPKAAELKTAQSIKFV